MVFKVDPALVVANIAQVTPEVSPLQAVQAAYNAAITRVTDSQREAAQVTVTIHVKPKEA